MSVRPEKHFAEELFRHQKNEAYADLRAERVKEKAQYLIKEGQECYPFTQKNMFEALGNVKESNQLLVAVYLSAAINLNGHNSITNELAICSIADSIKGYWLNEATFIAERDTE